MALVLRCKLRMTDIKCSRVGTKNMTNIKCSRVGTKNMTNIKCSRVGTTAGDGDLYLGAALSPTLPALLSTVQCRIAKHVAALRCSRLQSHKKLRNIVCQGSEAGKALQFPSAKALAPTSQELSLCIFCN